MIPLDSLRQTHRTQLLAKIASFPSAARFRTLTLSVFTSEPSKTREFRQAGMDPSIELEAHIALPLGTLRPEAEREFIEVTDLSGEIATYRIKSIKPLRGIDCYLLGLKSTRDASARPLKFGAPPV